MTFEEWFDNQTWGNEDFKTCLMYAWEAAFRDGYEKGVAAFHEAVAIEREECAKMCEDRPDLKIATTYDWTRQVGQDLARAIRMRSNVMCTPNGV